MTNKVYDILKWITIVVLPAVTTLWLALASIWNWNIPAEAIGATLTAITAFLGTILGISSINYAKKLKEGKDS